jgi:hypothetical protein
MVLTLGLALPARAQLIGLFQLDVKPTVFVHAGDVLQVSYAITFHSRGDSLASFAVKSPVPILGMTAPAWAADAMLLAVREGTQDAARWGWIEALPRNGETIPYLAYEAAGLPGIVRYRATRFMPPRPQPANDRGDDPVPLSFEHNGAEQIAGWTVGVVPYPADRSTTARIAFLRAQLGQACTRAWVKADVCAELKAKADGKANNLALLRAELDVQRGRGVNDAAYALLSTNVKMLLQR